MVRWRFVVFPALTLALWLDVFVTIEWVPDCVIGDGPIYAAYGLPMPYRAFSGFSLIDCLLPHVFIVNILILTSVFSTLFYFVTAIRSVLPLTSVRYGVIFFFAVRITGYVLWTSLGLLDHVTDFSHNTGPFKSLRPVKLLLVGARKSDEAPNIQTIRPTSLKLCRSD